ncbi:MAG TPA: glutamate synthase central domain-containing protein, partial [Dehalococcoidia bacterium]|nr:glutamate synthase central domain-containing protein [Dehalococcoidia bacterium]
MIDEPQAFGLYRREHEHDACGVGFVADVRGRPSHDILAKALEAVANLTHRGAVDAELTGDGAGIMSQLPKRFFAREAERLGVRVQRPDDLAVAMLFLPGREPEAARKAEELLEGALAAHCIPLLAWRDVPVDASVLSPLGRRTQPLIRQAIVGRPDAASDDHEYERVLYAARRDFEKRVQAAGLADAYVPSFSAHTIVYKGLMIAPQLPDFYEDLRDPAFETAIALYHQRYSTNTFPNWYLAQPFRLLAHNGEINTRQGNQNWMRAREPEFHSSAWGDRIAELTPIIQPGGSDSSDLDNVYEALVRSGRDPLHAMLLMVPEAWENMPSMDPKVRAFYEYHACLMEPWDGPAALSFTDGRIVGAVLDRNGLRPSRFVLTEDGLLFAGSEVGAIDLEDRVIVHKGRLGPGEMIAVDTERGVLLDNAAIKEAYSERAPYGEWLERRMVRLEGLVSREAAAEAASKDVTSSALLPAQRAFGYTREELQLVLRPMVLEAKEAVGSMGDDTPLAVLSHEPRLLYNYFRQKFAQVTNPPIDPIREQLVMSLLTTLGPRGSVFEEDEEHAHLLELRSPFLTEREMAVLRTLDDPKFRSATVSALFPVDDGAAGL